jgi:hypothetical protein
VNDTSQTLPVHEEPLNRVVTALERNARPFPFATFTAANGALRLQRLKSTRTL